MNRLGWAVVILLILSVIAAGIFLSTLDPNQIIPVVRNHLEQQLHAKIQYRTASLSFAHGVALELQDLVVKPENADEKTQPLTIEEARVSLDLAPLLRRKFEIGSIELVHPKLFLHISRQGEIEMPGFEGDKFKNVSASRNASQFLPMALLIQDVQLAEAEIQIQNSMQSPPEELSLAHLNLKMEHLVLGKPFHFFITGSLDSKNKNFAASGEMDFPRPGKDFHVRNLDFESDLNQLDTKRLWDFFAVPIPWPFQKNPGGTLKIQADKIIWDEQGVKDLSLDLGLTKSELAFQTIPEALRELTLKIHVSNTAVEFPVCDFKIADGQVSGAGRISSWQKNPAYDFQIKLADFSLESLQPPSPGEPSLAGKINLTLQGASKGQDSETFLSNLNGQGQIDWIEGRLENINILREVLSKISLIPGIVERLNRDLTPESKEKMNRTDTLFEPLHADFTIQNGTWTFPNALLATDAFQLSGSFQADGKGNVDASTLIRLDPDFTQIMTHSINELSGLTTSKGELELPIKITGQIPNLNFFPDLGYIGSKLATSKVSDLLNNFLGPKRSAQTEPSAAATEPSTPEASNPEPAPATPAPTSLRKLKLGKLLAAALTEPVQPQTTPVSNNSETPAQDQNRNSTTEPSTSSSVFDQLLQAALTPKNKDSENSTKS